MNEDELLEKQNTRFKNMYPNTGGNPVLDTDIITQLITKVQELNQYVRLTHVNKKSKYINMFPTLLEDPVEYFILTDLKEGVFYSLYITPDKINVL